ncbi:UNVERIFIED_CONTAM: hypothetical protein Slati_1676300 [Sesamum latifolium]|uniref:Uncharacterized protein n=1 Tax=Sesamum latifolium TaxID=2727402 RepID=A0AAW2WX17_9LAMI
MVAQTTEDPCMGQTPLEHGYRRAPVDEEGGIEVAGDEVEVEVVAPLEVAGDEVEVEVVAPLEVAGDEAEVEVVAPLEVSGCGRDHEAAIPTQPRLQIANQSNGTQRPRGAVPMRELFFGKIPMVTSDRPFALGDNIADAFHKSSHKILSYVASVIQKDEIVVRPSLAMSRDGARRWASTAVGYFWGKSHISTTLMNLLALLGRQFWMLLRHRTGSTYHPTAAGIGYGSAKHKHTQVSVWILLKHLPVEFWTNEGLSIVVSGIGRPPYQDAITKACTGLDFARVYMMLDISSKLPKHIVVMIPSDDAGEIPCRVNVEYEWLPPKCTEFGPSNCGMPYCAANCDTCIHVFVPKQRPPQHPAPQSHQQPDSRPP